METGALGSSLIKIFIGLAEFMNSFSRKTWLKILLLFVPLILDNFSKNNCVIWLLLCCHTWNWSGQGRTARRFEVFLKFDNYLLHNCNFLKKFVKFWTWLFLLCCRTSPGKATANCSPVFVYVKLCRKELVEDNQNNKPNFERKCQILDYKWIFGYFKQLNRRI